MKYYCPSVSVRDGFQDPPGISKSVDVQDPFIKQYIVCIKPIHILP